MNLNLAAKGEAAEERLELAGEAKPVQGCQVCKGKPETEEMKCSAPPAQICAQDAQHCSSQVSFLPFYTGMLPFYQGAPNPLTHLSSPCSVRSSLVSSKQG